MLVKCAHEKDVEVAGDALKGKHVQHVMLQM
jgi:hypothetical protein